MIKDFEVGMKVTEPLLVKEVSVRETKAKKEYLDITFTDGVSDINAKRWDWNGSKLPEKNMVLNVTASVSEWAGNLQLTVNKMMLNTELDSSHFAPKGNVDVTLYLDKARSLMDEISDPAVKDILERLFKDHIQQWETIPAAKSIHHAYVAGTLQHSVDVAIKVRALVPYLNVNRDLCIAGALLHDIGKLYGYRLDGAIIETTEYDRLLGHITIGVMLLEETATQQNKHQIRVLQHIIASHHGTPEHGAVVKPQCLEAWVVHLVDNLDAKANMFDKLNEGTTGILTAKEWALGGEMFTQDYINGEV